MSCVLDASMALSFVLADEFTDASERALASIAADGALVPALWEYEVLNALRFAQARGRITDAGLTHALRGLEGLPIELYRLPLDRAHLIDLAHRLDLSVYDASYAWLAMESALPLATLDPRLSRAAAQAGIELV